ncbi:SPFH domain-containing protein [Nannocystis sp. SCPEA4]|uniref:SPFH domain-containing protein n=1 Tax=Nannocystis sp. SCPEA4 TaxID=2996787 RepID=UPI0022722299|nr:SPFH domain-containing protein [Nannocystis sp. SCPEA4]
MKGFVRICQLTLLSLLFLWIAPTCFISTVPLGTIGVRSSNASGVLAADLEPGWTLNMAGIHTLTLLPSHYLFLDYGTEEGQGLQIRTRDNNNVFVDVSVPYRIKPGEAHQIMMAGNHVESTNGQYRFQRLAQETTVSVLREGLANLTSSDFYHADTRLKVADETLTRLNQELAPLHLEAQAVLVRAVTFRDEYEKQLQQIQLNEQNKLLDGAREKVAKQQQELDNYELGTNALANARQQDWIKRQADLERAYQVGFVDTKGDSTPGSARRALKALSDDERAKLREEVGKVLDIDAPEAIADGYLLGIKNIEAETLEYRQRVNAEADGVSQRLSAEGAAEVAAVQGEFESKINALLGSPAGRAYVAYKSAENVRFAETLTFQSTDGIPAVLRLRDFALRFMGGS